VTTVRRCAVLLGTPIDDVTLDETLDIVAAMVTEGRRSGRCHQIATVNVDFVVNAADDDALRAVMVDTDLAIPDGMGVVWGARLLGTPIRERTAGADLVPALVARAAHEGWRVCLFGGAPGVAAQAAELMRRDAPTADIVVVDAPRVEADGTTDPDVVAAVRDVGADIVAVALGNPKQERWIARHGAAIGAPVAIGIGGTLDFLIGTTTRAPMWMQRAGLEWIHRAASEPRRLVGRYAHDLVVFGPALVRLAWVGRRRRPRDGRGGAVGVSPGDETVIDLAAVHRLDNRIAAEIAAVVRSTRLAGGQVSIDGASPDVLADADRLMVRRLLDRP
jgi:N-acetylglucosaminyldiphosphoundecaprenol N-acetyl-beta-D-mannosaminyltransferase